MKPRIRPLSNLYHRWGIRLDLDGAQVAEALTEAGVIERTGSDSYREVENTKIDIDLYETIVMDILRDWKKRKENSNGLT